MTRIYSVLATVFVLCFAAMGQTSNETSDSFRALRFLEGTWDANVQNNSAVTLSGRYTFERELGGHVLARHSTSDPGCTAPATFDCKHGDILYVFQDGPGLPLKAIYFDNEGHVLHYNVSTPDPTSALFVTDPSQPGPQFRLVYELKGTLMSGKFQMKMPGQQDWKSYLEWSGAKK